MKGMSKASAKRFLCVCAGVGVMSFALLFPVCPQARGEAGERDKADMRELIEKRLDDPNNWWEDGKHSGSGAVVAGDLDLTEYLPWESGNRLARLEGRASLRISVDYPRLDGATAAFPLYAAAAGEVYYAAEDKRMLNYLGCTRTERAYERLISGDVDIIFVLQPSDEQLEKAKAAGVELRLTPLARDAFVFFVNGRNPVSGLSVEQIRDVYRKKITNWRELGGDDKKILPFQRPRNSGSQTAMIKEVMKGEELPDPLGELSFSMMGMLFKVSAYRDYEESIGYSFRFFTEEMIRNVPRARLREVFEDDRAESERQARARDNLETPEPVKLLAVDGVAPSPENIRSGTYPFTVEIFAVTAGTANPHARELVDWLVSPQGQELIEKAGYVGVSGAPE